MRFRIPYLVVALAAAALSCSTLTTSSDYDPATDFSQYKTWAWHDSGSIKDPILVKRVQSALESTLAGRGLTRNEDNPDLWVTVLGKLSQQTQITTYNTGGYYGPYGYGYRWGGYGGGMSTTRVEQIPVGTVIVDLADAKRKELVWRGIASDTLNPERSPEEKEAKLREALAKMFANYPPAKK
jgi:hypothetical protein